MLQFESLQGAVDRCIKELGQIDFVMYVYPFRVPPTPSVLTTRHIVPVQQATL